MKVIDNRREINKMRRVLYLDLVTMFQWVEAIMDTSVPPPERVASWKEGLKLVPKFEGEAYLKSHLDIYMQLPERGAAETVYSMYHRFLDGKDLSFDDVAEIWLIAFSKTAKVFLGYFVEKNQLRRRYFKKFLGRAEADQLLKKLRAFYEKTLEMNEAIGPSLKPLSGTTEPKDRK